MTSVARSTAPAHTLPLRVVVIDPPTNVSWALQLGRDELVAPTSSSARRVTFDFTVEVVEDASTGAFRLRGPAVQGKPGERFVYLCIGAYAGQDGTSTGGRSKVSLEGISRALIDAVKSQPAATLEAEFEGTGRKGGPAYASVPLIGDGWHVA